MPGPMTHLMFYKKLKHCLKSTNIKIADNYDACSLFAQGHDLLLYQCHYNLMEEKKLSENIALAKELQEYNFREFVYSYLKNAEKLGVLTKDSVKTFIGAGYIGHHILDMYTHPLIIYYAGDHVRTKHTKKWNHGIAENLIDIYIAEKYMKKDMRRYPVHKLFSFDASIFDDDLMKVLNLTLEQVYGYKSGGEKFYAGCSHLYWFMKTLKFDPIGVKRILFNCLELLVHGVNSFSYHRNTTDVEAYLNNGHELWHNPMNPNITSCDSLDDLFSRALEHTTRIISELDKMIDTGHVDKAVIEQIIPDRASTHGLECGQTLIINMTKEMLENERRYAHEVEKTT